MTQHTAAQQSQAQQLAAHEKETITVGLGALRIDDVVKVARGGAAVEISQEALDRIATTRKRIDDLANEPTPVYGVSTGFGALARRHIPSEMRAQLQRSLVRSHAAGSGPEVEREVIRALMLLRLSTLCTGHTGVRPVVAETYAAVLNAGITPVVYEYGSLGCSGDLAPLSHCALALLGEGEVRVNGADQPQPAATALADAGITARAGGKRRPGADQRHRRHARHAVPGHRRLAGSGKGRRYLHRDDRRRPARHLERVRR